MTDREPMASLVRQPSPYAEDPRDWTIYRGRRGQPRWFQRWYEAWLIVRGAHSLHRAYQIGLDHGTRCEYYRTVVMGGR